MTDEPTTKATQVREAPDQNEEDGDERETVSEEPHPSQAKAGTADPDKRSQGDRSKSSTQESKPAQPDPASLQKQQSQPGPQSQQNKPNPSGQQFKLSPRTNVPGSVVGGARTPGPVQETSPAGSQKGGGSPD